jgi:hypothetical protein
MDRRSERHKEDAFCITIDYQKDSNPSVIFQTLSELIAAFQDFDSEVARTISAKIESSVVLEEVGTGSIRAWFAAKLKDTDDEAIKKCDYKAIIGKLLVNVKYWLLNLLEDKETLDQGKIEAVQNKINELIEETQIKHLAAYRKVSQQAIVQTYVRTASSISCLTQNDKVVFSSIYGEVRLERQTHISEEIIENLIVAKSDTSESDVFLKVKKPDYLGESRWSFYLDSHPIEAKIEDEGWLNDFRNRKVLLRPGDSLYTRLKVEMRYDAEGVSLPVRYTIVKVHKIIEGNDTELKSLFD